MTLNRNLRVPMPKRGIIKYKRKDTTYVYHITRIYRNEKGKPTNDRVCIGKIDEESGMLIPNRNYYEFYASSGGRTAQTEIESIKSYGVTYTIDGILNELGLIEIMKKKFPKYFDQIIALAQYMLCEGNIMSHYEDWYDEVYPHKNIKLGSADISRIFQSIDYKSRMDFQNMDLCQESIRIYRI